LFGLPAAWLAGSVAGMLTGPHVTLLAATAAVTITRTATRAHGARVAASPRVLALDGKTNDRGSAIRCSHLDVPCARKDPGAGS